MSQTLPNSIETEQAMLSSMLAYPNSVQIASELGLTSRSFLL